MFSAILGIPWLIVVTRFLVPLPWGWSAKFLVAVLMLIASQHLQINRLSSGSVFDPEYPRPLILIFNVLFGTLVLLAIFQLTLDVMSMFIMTVNRSFPVVAPEVRYAMGILALCLSSYGVNQAIQVPRLKNVEVTISGLSTEFDGYRVLQLTDLHISRLFPAHWVKAVVERSNALDVDLIVITGDFIDGGVESRREDVAPLSELRARDGVMAIPGNHEYFFNYSEWIDHYRMLGLTVLQNEHLVISRGETKIVVAGVTDLSAASRQFPGPDLTAALRGIPKNSPVVLLDHQPKNASRAANAGVALQLSGHTHGGMVVGLDRIVARANNGFVSGTYQVGKMRLYVNNGTALWPGFALRLGIAWELTVFTLRAPRT